MDSEFRDLAGAYAWLNAHINYERQLGSLNYDDRTFALEQFARRLEKLGNPHQASRSIHVAGTRGKGSAGTFLEALLGASGARTAVFSSPHLREYRERVRIDGRMLTEAKTVDLMRRLARLNAQSSPNPPQSFKTVFETLTALFFLAAREEGVDWAIVEAGLGGRLDATNVLPPGPVLLTRIGWDHTHLLGHTLEAIATEKAAVLKPGGWAVVACQDPAGDAMGVFERRARDVDARLFLASELCPVQRVECHREGLRLRIGFEDSFLDLDMPIFGQYQAENIQNALAMFSRLRAEGLVEPAPADVLAEALGRVVVPGRMERVCRNPEVFIDGGHCPTAAAALAVTMQAHFGEEAADLLVGMMADKDHEGFLANLAQWPGWRRVICYHSLTSRSADPETLAEVARRFFPQVEVMPDRHSVLEFLDKTDDKKTRVVGVGSLYNISDFEDWGANRA